MKIKPFLLAGLLMAMKKHRSIRPLQIILIQEKTGKCEGFHGEEGLQLLAELCNSQTIQRDFIAR